MIIRDRFYIDGAWVTPVGTGTLEVIDASTEEVMGRVPDGIEADANRAVEAAARAFETWGQTSAPERRALLMKLREGLTARVDELGEIMAGEVGMPLAMSKNIQAGLPLVSIDNFIKILADYQFEERIENSLVVKEPVGVVAAITPWNYPLHQVMAKVCPALAAGCTVIVKPSEVAPLAAFVLAEEVHRAGFPPGVFNLITGVGPVAGEALARHPKVDMVSFTGSTRAGKRVAELASQTVKRVALELGGKSASIILEDADIEDAVRGTVNDCYFNSGQTCSAHTRMLVPRAAYARAAKKAREVAESFTLGQSADPRAKLGPLISRTQQERVRGYIRKGIEEGAELITGGAEQPDNLPKGFFVKPTVFGNVSPNMTIAQEEIFGPVLSIIPYDTEDEAVAIATGTVYGLPSGVWSAAEHHARRVARRIRAGQVVINGGGFNMMAPFGGYKQSGNGREHGPYALDEYLQTKALQM
ncbi:MAG: aldehyde dehydrogenase family protein [Gammaproteobacteria bacterium]|nr:aldehyde dehydrogenase family protein [Gammaproteobacteria bacterium]